jgi:glycolate oxidase FAD binding subunit
VRFVTGYGELVKGGGPTVKNVTGYDVPRLLVGSLGTLGVIVQVTLRCRPASGVSEWWSTSTEPSELFEKLFRPTSVLSDRERSYALLTGEPADVEVAHRAMADAYQLEYFALPDAPHRGRISVNPSALTAVTDALDDIAGIDLAWFAEWGVGTVHVATGNPDVLAAARVVAEAHGGWMLREAGAPDLDPFGVARPNRDLQCRVKAALDPDDKLARGRFG